MVYIIYDNHASYHFCAWTTNTKRNREDQKTTADNQH